jgi:multidrug transporter EmrE-like cation transporter
MGGIAGFIAVCALPFVAAPSLFLWALLVASVVLHIGYKIFIARAYTSGDLAQAFPLARGGVPLFATLIAYLTLGQMPNAAQWTGIALISMGVLTLAFDRLRAPIPGNGQPSCASKQPSYCRRARRQSQIALKPAGGETIKISATSPCSGRPDPPMIDSRIALVTHRINHG